METWGPCTDSKDTLLGTVGSGLAASPGPPGWSAGGGAWDAPVAPEPPPAAWNVLLDAAQLCALPGKLAGASEPSPRRAPHPREPCSPRPLWSRSAAQSLGVAWGQILRENPAMMVFPQTGHGVAELTWLGTCAHARAHSRAPCRSHWRWMPRDTPTEPRPQGSLGPGVSPCGRVPCRSGKLGWLEHHGEPRPCYQAARLPDASCHGGCSRPRCCDAWGPREPWLP